MILSQKRTKLANCLSLNSPRISYCTFQDLIQEFLLQTLGLLVWTHTKKLSTSVEPFHIFHLRVYWHWTISTSDILGSLVHHSQTSLFHITCAFQYAIGLLERRSHSIHHACVRFPTLGLSSSVDYNPCLQWYLFFSGCHPFDHEPRSSSRWIHYDGEEQSFHSSQSGEASQTDIRVKARIVRGEVEYFRDPWAQLLDGLLLNLNAWNRL